MELMVKQGYKQTEVGLIPEDWNIKPLSELLFESPKYGIGASAINFDYNSYTYLRITDIDENGRLIEEGLKSVNHSEASNYIIKDGELVFARTGASVGKSYLHNPKNGVLVYAGFLIKVNPNYNLLDSSYLRNQVNTSSYWNWITVNSMRSGQPGINSIELGTFLVPLPPTLAEQKSIARALNDVDELITNLDKLIAKKKAIKQGAMQQLLTPPHKGGKRLVGFTGEWMEKVIGKIGNTFGGLSGKTKTDFENGKYPYITFLNVMNNTIIDSTIFEYVNIKSGEQQNKARKGDLFFNTSSETPEEVGMCAILNEEVKDLYLNSFCFGFRLKEDSDIDGLLFSYLINSPIGRNLFLSLAQGATRYNLSKSNFNKLIIEVPPLKEQKAIAQILFDIDEEIKKLESKKSKYQSIKQGMMQELLTGKTRLI